MTERPGSGKRNNASRAAGCGHVNQTLVRGTAEFQGNILQTFDERTVDQDRKRIQNLIGDLAAGASAWNQIAVIDITGIRPDILGGKAFFEFADQRQECSLIDRLERSPPRSDKPLM